LPITATKKRIKQYLPTGFYRAVYRHQKENGHIKWPFFWPRQKVNNLHPKGFSRIIAAQLIYGVL
jgi:hypothetical protein